MNWNKAKAIIKKHIIKGTNLNTNRSSLREVIQTNHHGFLVRISNYKSNNLDITWGMLEKCFYSLKGPEGYNGDTFRRDYPQQARNHPCHVHVIGMIFKKAGIATSNPEEKNYYLIKVK